MVKRKRKKALWLFRKGLCETEKRATRLKVLFLENLHY